MPTAISTSTIARQAVRFMELNGVSSVSDGSPVAQALAEQYDQALALSIEAYDWSFARRMVTLPAAALPSGLAADPDLPGLFQLPDDFLRLHLVLPRGIAYRLDGAMIRAAQTDPLTIRYSRRLSNEAAFPPAFKDVVALQLAIRLAPEWVGSRTKRQQLKDDLEQAFAAAKLADHQTASADRLDGREDQPDWSEEATL